MDGLNGQKAIGTIATFTKLSLVFATQPKFLLLVLEPDLIEQEAKNANSSFNCPYPLATERIFCSEFSGTSFSCN
jgi:hypothetical protein